MEVKQKITEMVRALKQIDELTEESKLISNNLLDSFDLIRLVGKIEKEYTITISGTDINLENFDTITSIAKLIESSNLTIQKPASPENL